MSDLRGWLLLLGFVGCAEPKEGPSGGDAGTAVGNPGTVQLDVSSGRLVSVDSADVPLATVTVVNEAGEAIILSDGQPLDWMAGSLEIPPDAYTSILVNFDDHLSLKGFRIRDSVTRFIMDVQLRGFELHTAPGKVVEIGEDDVVIVQLGSEGFMDVVDPELIEGEETRLTDEDLREEVEERMRSGSGAGRDDDGDGQVDERTLLPE